MIILMIALAGAAFIAGYAVCAFATWLRIMQQDSHLRALATDLRVHQDMEGNEVSTEWVINRLETMIAKDYR